MAITPQQIREELTRIGRYTPEEIDDFVRRAEQGQTERERTRERLLGLGGPPDRSPVDPGGAGSHDTMMDIGERLARVEGGVEGLKGSLDGLRFGFTILAGAVALVAALMVGVKLYDDERRKTLTDAERAAEDEHLKNEINTW